MGKKLDGAKKKFHYERLAEAQWLLERLSRGLCYSIVGSPDVGVSYFLRVVNSVEVQRFFLPELFDQILIVHVDYHRLSQRDSIGGYYELITRSIVDALHLHAPEEMGVQDRIGSIYEQMIVEENLIVLPRFFEKCIRLLLEEHYRNLVFLIDHFEAIYTSMPSSILPNLRYIRDEFKYRISFVVGTSHNLTSFPDIPDYRPFLELFESVLIIKLMNKEESNRMLRALCERRGGHLEEDAKDFMIDYMGGHPGMIQAAFETVKSPSFVLEHGVDEAISQLLSVQGFVMECDKIWNYLSDNEKSVMELICTRKNFNEEFKDISATTLHLEDLGLLVKANKSISPFSAIFQRYVISKQTELPSSKLTVNPEDRRIVANARDITDDLSPLEYKLFFWLYDNRGRVCSKEELVKHVWNEVYQGAIDNYRIQKLVERLRSTFETDPGSPHHLVTVRGRGYKLDLD